MGEGGLRPDMERASVAVGVYGGLVAVGAGWVQASADERDDVSAAVLSCSLRTVIVLWM